MSLDIPAGQFVSVVGPSGCGKNTLLNAIAGLRTPSAGEVRIDGRLVSGVDRGVGYLFQRDALLLWRSVLSNVMLPLTYRGVAKREAERRARDWIARVELVGYEDRYPHQLSGGMRNERSRRGKVGWEAP